MYKLHIRDDEGRTTMVPLMRDEVTIGRKEGNTIRLTERNVSRQHARLVRQNGQLVVENLSRYGTRVNGQRVNEPTPLRGGDAIQIGDYEIALEIDKAAAAAEARRQQEARTASTQAVQDGDTALVNVADVQAAGASADEPVARPRLVAISTNLAGTEYPITKNEVTLGRTDESDVVVDHRSISRQHARIVFENGRYQVVDAGSANGLKVNGEEYKQAVLERGDILELGHVKLRFVEAGEAFVYDESLAEAEAGIKPSSRKGLWAFVVMLLLLGGAAAAWFGYFRQPLGDDQGRGLAAATEAPTAAPATAAPATGPGEAPTAPAAPEAPTAPAAPTAEQIAAQVAPVLATAAGHIKAERWDEATAAFEEALGIDPDNAAAKAGLESAGSEKASAAIYKMLNDMLGRSDFDGAWAEVNKLDTIPAESAYRARADELKRAIRGGFVTDHVDKGLAALEGGDFAKAVEHADAALAVEPDHARAKELKETARKREARAKAEAAMRNKEPEKPREPQIKEPPKPKEVAPPEPKEPDSGGLSGKDLYGEARKVHNSDPAKALTLYTQAANKGYATAWRQMGSIYLTQGNNAKAIQAYKKYLQLKPGASDAEVIRNTIIRLGGTP